MSDTRNHTTRDQLADALCRGGGDRVCINYDPDVKGGCSWCELDADALLASDAIAAVRAAAVAETTAAVEALATDWERQAEKAGGYTRHGTFAAELRAALSGGRTAPPGQWDEEADAMFIDKAREAMRDTGQQPR